MAKVCLALLTDFHLSSLDTRLVSESPRMELEVTVSSLAGPELRKTRELCRKLLCALGWRRSGG
jgi:hypothetical protein